MTSKAANEKKLTSLSNSVGRHLAMLELQIGTKTVNKNLGTVKPKEHSYCLGPSFQLMLHQSE